MSLSIFIARPMPHFVKPRQRLSQVWAGRLASWLLVAVLGLNQLLPIAWAELSPSPITAFAAAGLTDGSICTSGDHGGVASSSERQDHGAPHCPLCVLFGGTFWSPPDAVATIDRSIAAVAVAPYTPTTSPLDHAGRTLRPAPRAPPAQV